MPLLTSAAGLTQPSSSHTKLRGSSSSFKSMTLYSSWWLVWKLGWSSNPTLLQYCRGLRTQERPAGTNVQGSASKLFTHLFYILFISDRIFDHQRRPDVHLPCQILAPQRTYKRAWTLGPAGADRHAVLRSLGRAILLLLSLRSNVGHFSCFSISPFVTLVMYIDPRPSRLVESPALRIVLNDNQMIKFVSGEFQCPATNPRRELEHQHTLWPFSWDIVLLFLQGTHLSQPSLITFDSNTESELSPVSLASEVATSRSFDLRSVTRRGWLHPASKISSTVTPPSFTQTEMFFHA